MSLGRIYIRRQFRSAVAEIYRQPPEVGPSPLVATYLFWARSRVGPTTNSLNLAIWQARNLFALQFVPASRWPLFSPAARKSSARTGNSSRADRASRGGLAGGGRRAPIRARGTVACGSRAPARRAEDGPHIGRLGPRRPSGTATFEPEIGRLSPGRPAAAKTGRPSRWPASFDWTINFAAETLASLSSGRR